MEGHVEGSHVTKFTKYVTFDSNSLKFIQQQNISLTGLLTTDSSTRLGRVSNFSSSDISCKLSSHDTTVECSKALHVNIT